MSKASWEDTPPIRRLLARLKREMPGAGLPCWFQFIGTPLNDAQPGAYATDAGQFDWTGIPENGGPFSGRIGADVALADRQGQQVPVVAKGGLYLVTWASRNGRTATIPIGTYVCVNDDSTTPPIEAVNLILAPGTGGGMSGVMYLQAGDVVNLYAYRYPSTPGTTGTAQTAVSLTRLADLPGAS